MPPLYNTLQFFITNLCNKRCQGCFFDKQLGVSHMNFELYKQYLDRFAYALQIKKVILLGGEPTLHPELDRFVEEAAGRSLKLTIYTNGTHLDRLKRAASLGASIRVGVLGFESSEKPLAKIEDPKFDFGILNVVYMLRRNNIHELDAAYHYAKDKLRCEYFMLSSIRDISTTGSFWKDTEETIPNEEFKKIAMAFVRRHRDIDIHIANRGVFEGTGHNKCRFLNVYSDGTCTLCPFDISQGIKDDPRDFGRKCNKHHECLLQKQVYSAISEEQQQIILESNLDLICPP